MRMDTLTGARSVRKLTPGINLLLLPYPPFLLPEQGLFNCIYIKLEVPVVVHQRSVTKVWIEVPYDYAVIAESGESHLLVDVFPSEAGVPKLAVYGDLAEGMLCRYFKSRVDEEARRGVARVLLNIINHNEDAASVSRVVLPRLGFNMYYSSEGSVIGSDTVMILRSPSAAEVEFEEPKLERGMMKVPLVQRERRLLEAIAQKIPERFLMRWGY